MEEEYQQDPYNALIAEFGTRLTEVEEKQRLIRDRALLIGENLISTKEDYEKEFLEIKKELKQISLDLRSVKQLNKRIIEELGNLARRSELEILERQMKMFDPLKPLGIAEIKKLIKQEKK